MDRRLAGGPAPRAARAGRARDVDRARVCGRGAGPPVAPAGRWRDLRDGSPPGARRPFRGRLPLERCRVRVQRDRRRRRPRLSLPDVMRRAQAVTSLALALLLVVAGALLPAVAPAL